MICPTCGFAASPVVGLRATISTLQIGYPYIQASSQDCRACIHALPRALQYWTLPPCQGGLWGCHMSSGSKPHLLVEESSGTTTRPAVRCGPWASSIKKCLAGLPKQLGSRVFKARVHVSKAPDVGAIMGPKDM
jgi:hypothetical protein